jgi:hypothetical protein
LSAISTKDLPVCDAAQKNMCELAPFWGLLGICGKESGRENLKKEQAKWGKRKTKQFKNLHLDCRVNRYEL